jgi:hypothetical protein
MPFFYINTAMFELHFHPFAMSLCFRKGRWVGLGGFTEDMVEWYLFVFGAFWLVSVVGVGRYISVVMV